MRKSMRISFITGVVLALFTAMTAAQEPELLLRIETKGLTLIGLTGEVAVLKDMGTYAIARGTVLDVEALKGRGLNCEVLDTDPQGKEYYLVYMRDPAINNALSPFGDVLTFDGSVALVRTTREKGEALPRLGVEIAKLFMDPLVPVPSARTLDERLFTVHTEIQDMLNAVDQNNLQTTVNDLVAFGTRASNTAGGVAASNYIYDSFVSYGIADVSYHDFDIFADNVVATIPGSTFPENSIVFGGHYDSFAFGSPEPGADDNASGIAGILEAARIMSAYQFENTVVFIAFASEEVGLIGSHHYAQDAYNRGDTILGMLNVDMIGYLAAGDVADVDIIADNSSYGLRDLAFWAIHEYVPDFPAIVGSGVIGGSSDYASFTTYGYPAIWFFEDVAQESPYIHTPNDTVGLSLNSFSLATNCTKSMIATLASLAEPVDTIAIGHTPLDSTIDTVNPYPVSAKIVSVEPLAPGFPLLRYSINTGPYTEVVMAPTVNPSEYEADIPPQPLGTTVNYYIAAQDVIGSSDTSPAGAPDVTYLFRVEQASSGWSAAEVQSSTLGGTGVSGDAKRNCLATILLPLAFLLIWRTQARYRRV